MSKNTLSTGCLIGIVGVLVSVCVLVAGGWYLLFSLFEPSTSFCLYALVGGVCFGLSMYRVMEQSRSFRRETISGPRNLKAVGLGVGSGLAFWGIGAVLGAIYVQVAPPAGGVSFWAFWGRVLVGASLSAAVGATFYLPLVRNLGEVFIDHGGLPLYFTGVIGGVVGAVIGAIDSTQAALWWLKLLGVVGAGGGGAALGFLLGYRFSILFILLYKGGQYDTVVVPVDETEFEAIFLAKNGRYSMRIHPTMLTGIRYIAAYRLAESAVTHIARVNSIKPDKGKDPNWRIIYVHSPATAIGPIRLAPEGKMKDIRGPQYTSRALLQKARNLDEAF